MQLQIQWKLDKSKFKGKAIFSTYKSLKKNQLKEFLKCMDVCVYVLKFSSSIIYLYNVKKCDYIVYLNLKKSSRKKYIKTCVAKL